jgi:hypothetical protein
MRSANAGRPGVGVADGRPLGAVGDPHRGATVDVGDPQRHRPPAAARAGRHVQASSQPIAVVGTPAPGSSGVLGAAVQPRQQGLPVAAAAAHIQGEPRCAPGLLGASSRWTGPLPSHSTPVARCRVRGDCRLGAGDVLCSRCRGGDRDG